RALAAPFGVWYGIKYAEQPIGKLRFSSVQWPSAFNGTRDAKSDRKFCIQYVKTESVYGEDCLNLNVYRPSVVSPDKKLPVLVWIHGIGSVSQWRWHNVPPSFVCHSLTRASYGCDHQLQNDAFSALGIDNLGLQNQHQLLCFVHIYVSSFSGDPERINLTGKSAGAYSIGFHYQKPHPSPSHFHYAIFQSGSPTGRSLPVTSDPFIVTQF
ncbi:acetylcholinesterase, partial [Colletotrichum graminicola M1.001]